MIPFSQARDFVLDRCQRNAEISVALIDSVGAVLAETIVANEFVPPFANTAVDGFAVRSIDTQSAPVTLKIAGTIAAGMRGNEFSVGENTAVRIMTGAPVPDGADAIVMVEDTEVSNDVVTITKSVSEHANIRPAGDDMKPGDVVIEKGVVLTASHLGVLATLGYTKVRIVQKPIVGVISTGDELVDDGSPLEPGQIRDSNRLALRALLQSHGYKTIDLGLQPDDEDAIENAFIQGVEKCDAIVSSGGVSMGDFDFVKKVLSRIADMRWMQVAIKPAKPLAFGVMKRSDGTEVPIFGLPGNPVSSLVSYELFCRPGLRKMSGYAEADWDGPTVTATVLSPFGRKPDGKLHFARALCRFVDGRYVVESAGAQGSHQMAAMAAANALAVLPDGETVEPPASVHVRLLHS